MDLLTANDQPGAYPDSWYAATADIPDVRAPLQGPMQADVCVVGAGYTGLSAALHLAQAGRRVVVLEAQRVGFGASGRNGGQLGTGQRVEQPYLEQMLGKADARKLWDLGLEATDLVRHLIDAHGIDCMYRPGVAWTAESDADVVDLHAYADHMDRHYDHPLEVLDRDGFHAICPSPAYRGGVIDPMSGHLHPLRFALGLARAAEDAGVTICERSTVTRMTEGAKVTVESDAGKVTADHVILACNGYLGTLNRRVAARVMPINNFIAATAPLEETARVLTRDIAVADDRFVINYFRLSHDNRLLFGGGESYGYRFPSDIAAKVRAPMSEIFPHLADVPIDYAWGGTLAITMKRLPYLARLAPNVLSASGYSGHGVGTATHAGMLMAQAIQGQSDGFDAMAAIPSIPFPGGPRLRTPLLMLAMTWYSLRDRLGI
ncbi:MULTISPECIES: FAD-binding oxidoreductase [Roseobacteraceae]|uniref:NAD(P)/FAD-dependent oxidoreductase n=1 Tax=Roseobacteraceae TaxID=2854170 RepID=UPI001C473E57|nr:MULTISPECIES: FAD-binding oxidoreductase [Roseobacteraceae]MBV7408856.1 FAD-binding oxidoreductase [Maritimibacter sp. DP1N21-5]MBY5934457.1 FAD-binding oxidoreductase [Tateyamaria omphalii]